MSTISVPDTRQYPIAAIATFTYEDMVGSTVVNLFKMQVGSIVISGFLNVNTTFAGGSTHDCDLGDATDPDEYSTTVIELDGTAGIPANNVTPSGFVTTSAEPDFVLTPISTGGDPTSGSATVFITYLVTGRAHENYE